MMSPLPCTVKGNPVSSSSDSKEALGGSSDCSSRRLMPGGSELVKWGAGGAGAWMNPSVLLLLEHLTNAVVLGTDNSSSKEKHMPTSLSPQKHFPPSSARLLPRHSQSLCCWEKCNNFLSGWSLPVVLTVSFVKRVWRSRLIFPSRLIFWRQANLYPNLLGHDVVVLF